MTESSDQTEHASDDAGLFPLLWAVAMRGPRELPDEAGAREAVRAGLLELKAEAAKQDAWLVAVSALARGADLIFAEECLEADIPWKCILPFPAQALRADGFSAEEWSRAERCLARAYRVESVTICAPSSDESRALACRECGHRTVEAGDVIMILSHENPADPMEGVAEMAEYARTLNKPLWHWHPKTGASTRVGWPGEAGAWAGRTLFRSRVTELIAQAAKLPEPASQYPEAPDTSPKSAVQRSLEALFRRVDHLALQKQGDAQKMMQQVVFFHLLATTAAALSVTVVTVAGTHSQRHAGSPLGSRRSFRA